jgi:hypothetical protein
VIGAFCMYRELIQLVRSKSSCDKQNLLRLVRV